MTARLLKDPTTANCRIFVGHLATDEMNKNELEQHFSKYGVVIGSLINRGFGFVQFENDKSAQAAIQNEDGQMFKGRRIDVRPAKKDPHGNDGGNDKSKGSGGKQFAGKGNQGNQGNQFMPRNNSIGGNSGGGGDNQNQNQNTNFNQSNQDFGSSTGDRQNQNLNSEAEFDDKLSNNSPRKESFTENNRNEDEEEFQQFSGNNESFNSNNQKMDSNDSFNSGSQGRAPGNNQFGGNNQTETAPSVNSPNTPQNNQNRGGGNNQFNSGNQNRPANNNQNRNQNNQGGNQNSNQGNSGAPPRQRGNRGGKNRNKNRDNAGGGNNNFRDRSPLNRGPRNNDDKGGRDWDHNMMPRGNNFGRESFPDNGRFDDRFKDPIVGPNFVPRGGPNDYPPPAPEKNDCEIIVVNKSLTEYAEAIESRLKKMGLTVDLLFPNEEVPLSRVLGNIANRGCLYAVVVTQLNMEHASMTLNILHGLPQGMFFF